jgi:hypothetical protein
VEVPIEDHARFKSICALRRMGRFPPGCFLHPSGAARRWA